MAKAIVIFGGSGTGRKSFRNTPGAYQGSRRNMVFSRFRHQKHPRGNQLIGEYLERDFQPAIDFENFLYLSQVQQADGLRVAFEAHRKAKPFCMGTLYWQLNDCWPVASWSGIDYYGKWKALHYQAKRSFLPVVVLGAVENGLFSVHLVSDLLEDSRVTLKLDVLNFKGERLSERHIDLVARAGQSECVYSCEENDLLSGHDRRNIVVGLRLIEKHDLIADANVYFESVKNLQLEQPKFTWEVAQNEQGSVLKLMCERLAKSVHVRIDGLEPEQNLSDNFFDLLPGREKLIQLPAGVEVGGDEIHVTSVYESTTAYGLVASDIHRFSGQRR